MTAQELRTKFNDLGLTEHPKIYFVDAETYGNVCNEIFHKIAENAQQFYGFNHVPVLLGPNNGIMFKNIELILDATNNIR